MIIEDTLGGTMDSDDLDKHQDSKALGADVAHDSSLEDLNKGKKKRKRKKIGAEKVYSSNSN